MLCGCSVAFFTLFLRWGCECCESLFYVFYRSHNCNCFVLMTDVNPPGTYSSYFRMFCVFELSDACVVTPYDSTAFLYSALSPAKMVQG